MIDYSKLLSDKETEKAELQKAFASDPGKFSYRTQLFYTNAIRACVIAIQHYERKLRLQQHATQR
jgi:hypothetical protein